MSGECKPGHHSWVAGMMVVHPEDVASVAAVREVVCETCDKVYDPDDDDE